MTLSQLKQALRDGKTPDDLPSVKLGSGSFRTAYKVGPFVVKRKSDSDYYNTLAARREHYGERERQAMRELKMRFAPTVEVDGWQVQMAYRPFYERPADAPMFYPIGEDIFQNNVGIDKRGRYVAFDW